MTQSVATDKVVSTPGRLVNGAVTATGALLTAYLGTKYGWPPEFAMAAGAVVGGAQAVLGSAVRDAAEKAPPKTFFGTLLVGVFARVG